MNVFIVVYASFVFAFTGAAVHVLRAVPIQAPAFVVRLTSFSSETDTRGRKYNYIFACIYIYIYIDAFVCQHNNTDLGDDLLCGVWIHSECPLPNTNIILQLDSLDF